MKLFLGLTLSAALAASTALAGSQPAPKPKMSKESITLATKGHADNGAWVGIGLTFIVIVLGMSNGSGYTVSDARLKTDITQVGATEDGLPIYQFRYLGDKTVYQGVMAQDVLAHRPDAVVMIQGDYMAVDYDKLGVDLKTIR